MVIPRQGPSPNKKTRVIPWGESTEAPMMIPRQTLRIPIIPKTTVVIRGRSPTPYESNKAVPWSYDSIVYVNGLRKECELSTSQGPAITNIAGTGGITRSVQIYGPKT